MAKKTSPAPASTNGVLPKLKAVYEFMTSHNLEALELDEAGMHLKMVRRRAVAPMPVPVPVMMTGSAPASTAPATISPGAAVPAGTTVKSSMMGIFYRAPSPSSPPFVKEGEAVKPGQILCMIEAMKVFNEIKAEFPCTVVKVLLENGKPVKAGQDLILVQRV
ncbi:MAG: acetyl-CoA carboxylase biotin carboxyl carrier protein [Elusimicrobia bacterium]|nr:acetyl-CoA carboxylase biotin carboxyl carrier protein [Elusimicrobiota bacterium]